MEDNRRSNSKSQRLTNQWLSSVLSDENSNSSDMPDQKPVVSAHWFRHGIRLHDNPALLESINNCERFFAFFIFDGETAGMKSAGYNRVRFLCEALGDINQQLKRAGGELLICRGSTCDVIKILHKDLGVQKLTFEQDCEAIWNLRDEAVRTTCDELGVEVVEKVSHTLWNPCEVIEANGGHPPLTYEMFVQVTSILGLPPQPLDFPNLEAVKFGDVPDDVAIKLQVFSATPTPEELGFPPEGDEAPIYVGGETAALRHLKERLEIEKEAFKDGYILPNQVNPDILGPPMSMSAALRFGCLSVRKFYWDVQKIYYDLYKGMPPPTFSLTAQLIWREFFYCMSVNNPKYDLMDDNPICIQIPWYDDPERLTAWEQGKTGYPFIDACMRQLRKEGWIHHACRTAVACFLTRGDLWISWEEGLKFFLRYLIDADWSVCAGNWMWISSSAFERQLDCSTCICPVSYGRRIEPSGEYIRRYIPELAKMPQEYLFKPWRAPMQVQRQANCIIGEDYPDRIVVHSEVAKENRRMMKEVAKRTNKKKFHCRPSNPQETERFLCLSESCYHIIDT